MRLLRILLVAGIFSVLAGEVFAQQTPPRVEFFLLRQFTGSPNSGRMNFRLVEGRIALDGQTFDSFQSSRSNGLFGGSKESMTLSVDNGLQKVVYEISGTRDQCNVEVVGGDLTIRRNPRGKATFDAVEFRQMTGKDIVLLLGSGDKRREYRAADIWRLVIEHRDECRTHLIPLLDQLRADWKLATMANDIETKLAAMAGSENKDRARWETLVAQLGDESFARREAADRALREGGAAVTSFLRQIDIEKLDAEQKLRVRRIIASMVSKTGKDSADDAAAMLLNDSAVWFALLDRPEQTKRIAAVKQLAILLGEPIDIDANADPASQKDKREALRKKLKI